jgi:hypothetical protein
MKGVLESIHIPAFILDGVKKKKIQILSSESTAFLAMTGLQALGGEKRQGEQDNLEQGCQDLAITLVTLAQVWEE